MSGRLTESELLAELQILADKAPPERNGMFTTEELARAMSSKLGISVAAAKRRVRQMWQDAQYDGRLEIGRVQIKSTDGRTMQVAAYKLKEA